MMYQLMLREPVLIGPDKIIFSRCVGHASNKLKHHRLVWCWMCYRKKQLNGVLFMLIIIIFLACFVIVMLIYLTAK